MGAESAVSRGEKGREEEVRERGGRGFLPPPLPLSPCVLQDPSGSYILRGEGDCAVRDTDSPHLYLV